MKRTDIKAVLFDYDDTLYSHRDGEIPPLTKEALFALKENGYLLGLCTSRFPSELQSFPKDVRPLFDAWIEGTGCLLYAKDNCLDSQVIAPDTVQELLSVLDEEEISYLWTTDQMEEHFSRDPGEMVKNHVLSWRGYFPTVQAWQGEPLLCITYYHADELQIKKILAYAGRIKLSRWGSAGQINAKGIDKAYGLKKFADAFHLDVKQIAVFGDGANDISMIDAAGIGVAVGNANEELQKHAMMVTRPIEEGGIYDACLKLGLITNKRGIQILFLDIDGTTYQNNIRDVPANTRKALSQLRENGFKLVIDTSRSKQEMIYLPKDFIENMDAVIMLAGGQIEMNGNTLYHYLSDSHIKKAVDYMELHNIIYRWVDDQGNACLSSDVEEINAKFYRLYSMVPPVKKWNGERLVHLLYYTNDVQEIQEIDSIFSTETHIHYGFGHEQVAHGMGKASSMELVSAAFGLTIENTAAFGDGANDALMIKNAKIGVAMGNACDACKEAADYVTDNIEEDGFYNACKQFGWIKE